MWLVVITIAIVCSNIYNISLQLQQPYVPDHIFIFVWETKFVWHGSKTHLIDEQETKETCLISRKYPDTADCTWLLNVHMCLILIDLNYLDLFYNLSLFRLLSTNNWQTFNKDVGGHIHYPNTAHIFQNTIKIRQHCSTAWLLTRWCFSNDKVVCTCSDQTLS